MPFVIGPLAACLWNAALTHVGRTRWQRPSSERDAPAWTRNPRETQRCAVDPPPSHSHTTAATEQPPHNHRNRNRHHSHRNQPSTNIASTACCRPTFPLTQGRLLAAASRRLRGTRPGVGFRRGHRGVGFRRGRPGVGFGRGRPGVGCRRGESQASAHWRPRRHARDATPPRPHQVHPALPLPSQWPRGKLWDILAPVFLHGLPM